MGSVCHPVQVALGVPETLAPLIGLSSLCGSTPTSLVVPAPLGIPNIPAGGILCLTFALVIVLAVRAWVEEILGWALCVSAVVAFFVAVEAFKVFAEIGRASCRERVFNWV